MTGIGNSDAPLKSLDQDRLGLGEYARALAEFIDECETPMTVAIQGDWGTGKTSLMHMVDNVLGESKRKKGTETIWFQTWQYSQFGATETLSLSLLSTLLREIGGEDGNLVTGTLNVLKKLAKPTINAGLRAATGGVADMRDFTGVAGVDPVDLASNAEELKQRIGKIVSAKRSKGTSRIVIFVDDLDRVVPERAVDILETIKLFMDLEGCVFVLALDYEVVKRGLQRKFGLGENDLGGRSFFDKIIQLPFSVPTARYTTHEFIGDLFNRMNLKAMRDDDKELFSELARNSVSTNPRAIKRVFNSMQLLLSIAKAKGLFTDKTEERLVIRNLFALLCLQNRFEPIYNWISFNAERLDEATLRKLEGKSDSGSEEDEDRSFSAALEELLLEGNGKADRALSVFSGWLLNAVQNPELEDEDDQLEPSEIERLQNTLMLTQVTAISPRESAPAGPLNQEFRRENRKLMARIHQQLDKLLDTRKRRIHRNQPHSESAVYLTRRIDKTYFDLQLIHSENSATIRIDATARRLQLGMDEFDRRLSSLSEHYRRDGDGRPYIWTHIFSGNESFKEREAILKNQAIPIIKQVNDAWNNSNPEKVPS
jgi:hypothetical protein